MSTALFMIPTEECQRILNLGASPSKNLENFLFRAAQTKIKKPAVHHLHRKIKIILFDLLYKSGISCW
jgi:hypothetical protein